MLAAGPRSGRQICRDLWDAQVPLAGRLGAAVSNPQDHSLVSIVRLAALTVDLAPDDLDDVLSLVQDPDVEDIAQAQAAATVALGQPRIMRWISANAKTVVRSDVWKSVLPGIGGVTKSVPLAEEALFNIVKTRKKLPPELTGFVQLNPWFSRRFAIRYRRRMKGKRIRIPERGATLRGWAHSRTIVEPQLPNSWVALHGRGAGRPLDWWSEDLLSDYADLCLAFYSESGIPAVMAPLFAITHAGCDRDPVEEDLVTSWKALPAPVETKARALVGLPERDDNDLTRATSRSLCDAAAICGSDLERWSLFAALAYGEGAGPAAAVAELRHTNS